MSNDNITDDGSIIQPFTYDVTPKRVRFSIELPDGMVYIALTADEWADLGRTFDHVIHKAKPLTDNDLPHLLSRIDGLRHWSDRTPLVTLVNIAKRADGTGYILRVFEPAANQEWNLTTWGEFEAMERGIRGMM